jgi:hypothetical protein
MVYLLLVFALFILENDSFVGHAIGSDIWTCLFLILNSWFECGMFWLWTMYTCVLIDCCYFSGDRFERRVCGRRRGLRIPRGRRPGTSQPRQAIYLMHIWILLLLYALLTLIPLLMHYILYCYWPLDSNRWWLSSTSQLDIILWDDTYCNLLQHPFY